MKKEERIKRILYIMIISIIFIGCTSDDKSNELEVVSKQEYDEIVNEKTQLEKELENKKGDLDSLKSFLEERENQIMELKSDQEVVNYEGADGALSDSIVFAYAMSNAEDKLLIIFEDGLRDDETNLTGTYVFSRYKAPVKVEGIYGSEIYWSQKDDYVLVKYDTYPEFEITLVDAETYSVINKFRSLSDIYWISENSFLYTRYDYETVINDQAEQPWSSEVILYDVENTNEKIIYKGTKKMNYAIRLTEDDTINILQFDLMSENTKVIESFNAVKW